MLRPIRHVISTVKIAHNTPGIRYIQISSFNGSPPVNTHAEATCSQYTSGGLFSRGRSCTIGTTQPPECIAGSFFASGSAAASNICRLACANRDSSRSIGGIVNSPGRYTVRHSSTSTTPAHHERENETAARRSSRNVLPHFEMTQSQTRITADYNRTLAPPVRWLHAAARPFLDFTAPITTWAGAPSRRLWVPPLIWGALLAAILIPFDGAISQWAATAKLKLGGDVRRELELLQQYGDLATLLITATLIALLDPKNRRRLADLAAAALFTSIVVFALKMLVGRPRPEFNDPLYLLGPLGSYPIDAKVGVRHAWEFWSGISSKLWSMPSSHTAAAVALSVFLTALYPRLKPFTITMPIIVAACRVLFTSHYPSDVAAGAMIGLAATRPVVHGAWGLRIVKRLSGQTKTVTPSHRLTDSSPAAAAKNSAPSTKHRASPPPAAG